MRFLSLPHLRGFARRIDRSGSSSFADVSADDGELSRFFVDNQDVVQGSEGIAYGWLSFGGFPPSAVHPELEFISTRWKNQGRFPDTVLIPFHWIGGAIPVVKIPKQ